MTAEFILNKNEEHFCAWNNKNIEEEKTEKVCSKS